MTIKIYQNWMRIWEPVRQDWEQHRELLHPLCTCGSIGFKKKEDLVSFFASNGLQACEENATESKAEQLTLF